MSSPADEQSSPVRAGDAGEKEASRTVMAVMGLISRNRSIELGRPFNPWSMGCGSAVRGARSDVMIRGGWTLFFCSSRFFRIWRLIKCQVLEHMYHDMHILTARTLLTCLYY